jgi:hypothetical protein
MLIQVLLIIDFSYGWNALWLENYENDNQGAFWMVMMFLFSGVLLVGAAVIIAMSYVWFTDGDACGLNIFLVT